MGAHAFLPEAVARLYAVKERPAHLPRAPLVPDVVTDGGETVAVRVPDHALVRALCRHRGAPPAATSANRHGKPAPVTAEQIHAHRH